MPQDRRLLDEALGVAPRDRGDACRPATPGRGRAVIVKRQADVGPFQLVLLITDGEIETPHADLECVRQKLAQVQHAGTVTGQAAVAIARQYMVVAVAEQDREIRRRAGRADIDAADMGEMPRIRVAGEIGKELMVTGPRKNVADALAGEYPLLLRPED